MTTITENEIIIRIPVTNPVEEWVAYMVGFSRLMSLARAETGVSRQQCDQMSDLMHAIVKLDDKSQQTAEAGIRARVVQPMKGGEA